MELQCKNKTEFQYGIWNYSIDLNRASTDPIPTWYYPYFLLTSPPSWFRLSALSLAVEQTRVCRKLISAQGRGRYLLRLALGRKTLSQFFAHLLHTPRVLEVRHAANTLLSPIRHASLTRLFILWLQWYSPTLSILRNEEFVGETFSKWRGLVKAEGTFVAISVWSLLLFVFCVSPEPFMSLLLVLSHMEFKLDTEVSEKLQHVTRWYSDLFLYLFVVVLFFLLLFKQNCSFLDESWLLPVGAPRQNFIE